MILNNLGEPTPSTRVLKTGARSWVPSAASEMQDRSREDSRGFWELQPTPTASPHGRGDRVLQPEGRASASSSGSEDAFSRSRCQEGDPASTLVLPSRHRPASSRQTAGSYICVTFKPPGFREFLWQRQQTMAIRKCDFFPPSFLCFG